MKKRLVLAAVSILVLVILSSGLGPYRLCQSFVDLVGDKLEWQSRSIAGSGALDCGRVESGHDARVANDCVRNALASSKPFRVRYEVQSIDSGISSGLVRSQSGPLYELVFDGNPGHAGPTSLFRQRLAIHACAN